MWQDKFHKFANFTQDLLISMMSLTGIVLLGALIVWLVRHNFFG